MNLANLFEMQQVLDNHIIDEHPELKDQDNIDWKILALQVELGECANEWRGFKKWSNDQLPRLKVVIKEPQGQCADQIKYPLLEEFVDCLHFILSIGLELAEEWIIDNDFEVLGIKRKFWSSANTIKQFQTVFRNITDFERSYDFADYIELVSQFLGLGEMLGFSMKQIEQAYFKKNAVNHQRQESGY